MISANFGELLADHAAAAVAEVDLISAGIDAETADPNTAEGSQQHTPYPSGSPHFVAHAGY